jgi:hypothetical protein
MHGNGCIFVPQINNDYDDDDDDDDDDGGGGGGGGGDIIIIILTYGCLDASRFSRSCCCCHVIRLIASICEPTKQEKEREASHEAHLLLAWPDSARACARVCMRVGGGSQPLISRTRTHPPPQPL